MCIVRIIGNILYRYIIDNIPISLKYVMDNFEVKLLVFIFYIFMENKMYQ